MFFSRIQMNMERVNPIYASRVLQGGFYYEHKMIWDFFPEKKEEKRDFLYRRFDLGRMPQYYLLSKRKPVTEQGIWNIETKEYDPVIRNGDRLSFNLRVNPVVTKMIEGIKSKKRKRDDVYMEALSKYKTFPREERPTNNEIMVESGLAWIMGRAEQYGFSLKKNQVLVEGYSKLYGLKDKDKHRIQLGIMDYSGILVVTDSELFRKTLIQGIGKAKSFGCGLLLLKPV